MTASPLLALPEELIEHILLSLPPKDMLFAPKVCRQIEQSIAASARLQQALFFKPRDLLTQKWVEKDVPDDFRLTYTSTSSSEPAAPPEANPFLPLWSCPALIEDIRHVNRRLELHNMPIPRAALDMFVSQPPTTSLALFGRGGRDSRETTDLVLFVRSGIKIGHLIRFMKFYGDGAFVMIVGSKAWQ